MIIQTILTTLDSMIIYKQIEKKKKKKKKQPKRIGIRRSPRNNAIKAFHLTGRK